MQLLWTSNLIGQVKKQKRFEKEVAAQENQDCKSSIPCPPKLPQKVPHTTKFLLAYFTSPFTMVDSFQYEDKRGGWRQKR
jgi:hypothetical protein